MTTISVQPADLLFADAGALHGAYRTTDWASTSLGPVEDWPPALRTAVTICLASRFPIALLWGPDLVMLYNEAYLPIHGSKEGALGVPCAQVWPEVWPTVGPMVLGVLAGGPATYVQDQRLLLERHGFPEECYLTYSYSAIRTEDGSVAGVFSAVTETTSQILACRRSDLVCRLTEALAQASKTDMTTVVTAVLTVLDRAGHDLTGIALYGRVGEQDWTRRGRHGLRSTVTAAQRQRLTEVGTARSRVGAEGPDALVVHLPVPVGACGAVVLACHLDPQVARNPALTAFLTQLAQAIGAGISAAASWEAERRSLAEAQQHQHSLLRNERHTAEVLQRSLLPVLPRLEEVEIAARYAPGGRDVQVGGDWYDVIDLGGGRTALVIGDVMGRGVAAAAVMGQLRAAVRAYAQLDLLPADILTLLDLIVDQLGEMNFVTCLYGVYDPVDRSLTIANAGHFAPLMATTPEQPATTLDLTPDCPLGSGLSEYRNHRFIVPPQSVLALFTDGLVESRGHDIEDGLQTLGRTLALQAGQPLEQLADLLLARMRTHHPHDDDTALLLVRTPAANQADTGYPHTLSWTIEPGPAAVRHGRSTLSQVSAQWQLTPETLDGAQVVLSELITNALRHGVAPLQVRLRTSATALYLEVSDASPYRPHRRTAATTDEDGRGLLLVDTYSQRWGVRPRATGKVVWAELPR